MYQHVDIAPIPDLSPHDNRQDKAEMLVYQRWKRGKKASSNIVIYTYFKIIKIYTDATGDTGFHKDIKVNGSSVEQVSFDKVNIWNED